MRHASKTIRSPSVITQITGKNGQFQLICAHYIVVFRESPNSVFREFGLTINGVKINTAKLAFFPVRGQQ